jgi:histidine ammonia-lyase
MSISLDGNSLTLESFKKIVFENEKVSLSKEAISKIKKSRDVVEKAAKTKEKVYSINTGFGYLSKVTIPNDQLEELQLNLIRSHCTGVGEILSEQESRAMLLLRANVLAKAFSGVRLELVEMLIEMLNKKIHPVIPSKGSVGASGDLAPLAHLASVLLGEGEAFFEQKRVKGKVALEKAGLKPITLQAKEGLSLINGTQFMTGMGAISLLEIKNLLDLSDLICAASIEGLLGSAKAFTPWLHQTRPHAGQIQSAKNILSHLKNSAIAKSHEDCDRVQDPYSFRCAPQVHGAARDLVNFVKTTIEIEMNSATDNPLVNIETEEIFSNGNFHGQPVAFGLDILAIAISEISSISERRIAKLIDPQFTGLPAFLVKNEGLNSGYMIAQVTAASLVSENKLFANPASTDSIPTSNEKEDHVSMGPIGALKLKTIIENAYHVLAIEALVACQALDFRKPLKPGTGVFSFYEKVRKQVKTLEADRYLHIDITTVVDLLKRY